MHKASNAGKHWRGPPATLSPNWLRLEPELKSRAFTDRDSLSTPPNM